MVNMTPSEKFAAMLSCMVGEPEGALSAVVYDSGYVSSAAASHPYDCDCDECRKWWDNLLFGTSMEGER